MKKILSSIIIALSILTLSTISSKADGGMTITNLTTSSYVGCAVVYCITDTNDITTSATYVNLNAIAPNGGIGMLDVKNTPIPGYGFTMQESLTNDYTVVAYPFIALLEELYCDFGETGYELIGGSSTTVNGDVFYSVDNNNDAEEVADYCEIYSCSLSNHERNAFLALLENQDQDNIWIDRHRNVIKVTYV